jgi:hypothetical protein
MRSARPRRPDPPSILAPPTRSSTISTTIRPSVRRTLTLALVARAYLATLVRLSATRKYGEHVAQIELETWPVAKGPAPCS